MPHELVLRDRLKGAVGIHYIGHRLGQATHSERWLRARIDWLVENKGFPRHLPSPRVNERIYSARAVDAWFDSWYGEADHAGIDAADRKDYATLLDARAAQLSAG
ncbi:MAG: hypothetical protein ACOYLS_01440 [Polymorphobacter sp.]